MLWRERSPVAGSSIRGRTCPAGFYAVATTGIDARSQSSREIGLGVRAKDGVKETSA
jgi:hypothetical protein